MLKRLVHENRAYSKRRKSDREEKKREAKDLLLRTGPQKFQPALGTRTEPLTEQDWRDVALINNMLETMELDRQAIHGMPFPISFRLFEGKGMKERQVKLQLCFTIASLCLPAVETHVEYAVFGDNDLCLKYPLSRLAERIGVIHDRSSVIQAVKATVAETAGHYGRLRAIYNDICQAMTRWFSNDWTTVGVHEFDLTDLRETLFGMRQVQFINEIDIALPLERISVRLGKKYVPKEGYFAQLRAFLDSTLPCVMCGDSYLALQKRRDAVARWAVQNPLSEDQLAQPIAAILEKPTKVATRRDTIVAIAATDPEPEEGLEELYDLF